MNIAKLNHRINDIEDERRLRRDARMQRRRRIPGLEADASDPFPHYSGRVKRDTATVAKDYVASLGHAENANLKTLKRGIHVARRALAGRFLTEDVPWLEGGAQFEIDPAVMNGTEFRKAELEERPQPFALERDTAFLQIAVNRQTANGRGDRPVKGGASITAVTSVRDSGAVGDVDP